MRTSPQPGTRVVRVALGELLDQSSAGLVDTLGHDDLEDDEQVAGGLGPRGGDPLALEPELQPAGAARAGWSATSAIERGDVDLGPEDGLGHGDRDLDLEVRGRRAGNTGAARRSMVIVRSPAGHPWRRARPGP